MINLFNLELKDDNPLNLASQIRAIMYDVYTTKVKMDIPLMTFFKVFCPKYSHYLESLQASMKLKDINFDYLVEKFLDKKKSFGKRKNSSQTLEE